MKYRDEEALLAAQDDPERYNNEVLWPDKVRLNREYVENWSFWGDIRLIMKTISRSADYSDCRRFCFLAQRRRGAEKERSDVGCRRSEELEDSVAERGV